LFMISPNDTLFLLPPFNLFLIQGIAGSQHRSLRNSQNGIK
jgi:hypothetical protein